MTRPYFQYSGNDLCKLYESSKDDPGILKDLVKELKHRERPKMQKLLKDAKRQLDWVSGIGSKGSDAITPSSGSKEQTTKPKSPAKEAPTPRKEVQPPKQTTNQPTKPAEQKTIFDIEPILDTSEQKVYEADSRVEDEVRSNTISTIRCSGNIKDTPPKFVFNLDDNVELDLDASEPLVRQYEAGIQHLIAELRIKGAGAQKITLENGKRVDITDNNIGYQFPFDGEVDLFEGAKVVLFLNSNQTDGQIAAVFSKKIILSVSDDFGETIPHCILKVDNTAMLEALQTRLKEVAAGEIPGFNKQISEAVINNSGDEKVAAVLPEALTTGLNSKQVEAVRKFISNEIFYLWGPPGTGKTQTISVAVQALLDIDKKILLCSNTNQAVDQVLLKICKKFGEKHNDLVDGKIVRIGKISHPELESDWYSYVNLDGIVERKSVDLNREKRDLEGELEKINKKYKKIKDIASNFEQIDKQDSQNKTLKSSLLRVKEEIERQKKSNTKFEKNIQKLKEERERAKYAILTKLFRRSIENINIEIVNYEKLLNESIKLEKDKEQQLNELTSQQNKIQENLISLKIKVGQYDLGKINAEIKKLEKDVQPIKQRIAEINRELEDISKSVVNNAKILGATVTKSFLSPKLFSNIDVVIIDEASMVMLPALFYASGLAKEKVIISGDFQQLSPIVQTNQRAIVESIGRDIFQSSGITDAFQKGEKLKRVVMLNEQYRMDDSICKLISGKMYKNELITSPTKPAVSNSPQEPFDKKLILIDTSTIYPFSNKDLFKSRYNLMNALTVRNLCKHFKDTGFLITSSIGVCTPYAAQSKLLSKILDSSGLSDVDAGTVHRFQGDEKDTLIFDIPDSLGEKYAGIFLQADCPEDSGAKLINVAISRAKERLIVIGNLAFLDQKLPNHSFLRDILCEIQNTSTVIDAREVLGLWSIFDDLKKYGSVLDLDADVEKTGLFNQKDFDFVSQKDLANAKRSIVFFSGFITEQRVAVYSSLFRLKIAEGVKIRCVTRPPHRNGTIPEQSGKAALDALEHSGCVVDTRGSIHEKVVIVDGKTVWFGSLNPLSHTAKTSEVMARLESEEVAQQLIAFLSITKSRKSVDGGDIFIAKENPICPECESRVSYMTGRFGSYWECEGCSWRQSLNQNANSRNGGSTKKNETGPNCPKCGSKTYKRTGRFGAFFGCSEYPKCNGKVNITTKN